MATTLRTATPHDHPRILEVMPGWWTDAGTFDSWYYANSLMFQPTLSESQNPD